MLRVRCQAHATLDAKGRLALPAPLRRACAEAGIDSLVLSFHGGAVLGWTPADFEALEAKVETQDPFAQSVMDFAHAIFAPAQDCEIDGQGRIRVPPPLRELAQLDKDVVVNSMLNKLEIWDRGRWERRFVEALERREKADGMPGAGS